MERNEALKRVMAALVARNIGRALSEIHNYLVVYPQNQPMAEFNALRNEYEIMARYWRQGYKDPQLEKNYNRLLQRVYTLYADLSHWRRISSSPFLSATYSQLMTSAYDWSVSTFRMEMESFVSNVAMVALEPENRQSQRLYELHVAHQKHMELLFNYLYTSRHWSEATSQAFEEMLLSPTIDSNDQQLLVSAITLSLLNTFDFEKFRLLVNVYSQSVDEPVRQRALVGWVMGRNYTLSAVFPEEREMVEHLLEDEQVCQELTELQIQMIYCMNAQSDHAKIQSEIIPDLLRNSNLRITRNGLEEKDEDPMEDILHPEASEERMEQMEQTIQKMVDMEKQGADIYYAGFSQMKRFPFFQRISNWFVPFSMNHPDLHEELSNNRSYKFLEGMLQVGTFCNSDKYSLVLAFSQVVDRLPMSLREAMQRGEMTMMGFSEIAKEQLSTPTYIRRMYLQDLYRFFRVFPHAAQFDHPFKPSEELGHVLFFASPLFRGTPLEHKFDKVVSLLMRQNRSDDAKRLLQCYSPESRTFAYYMMTKDYEQALMLQPENEKAMQGWARTLFARHEYEQAAAQYERLINKNPGKQSYELNRAVCLSSLGRYGEALQTLFRMNYERPDDMSVSRVLAWTLTCDGRYEQALTLYDKLTTDDANPNANPNVNVKAQRSTLNAPRSTLNTQQMVDDLLNKGFCHWFEGSDLSLAVSCFKRYLELTGETADAVLESEKELLTKKGISEPERLMMLDAIMQ